MSVTTVTHTEKAELVAILQKIYEYEKILDDYKWKLGDWLIKHCGPPTGVRDGSHTLMETLCAEICEEIGIEICRTITWWAQIRMTAWNFPPEKRRSDLGFWAHREASAPDTLDKVVEDATAEGKKVTGPYIREHKKRQERAASVAAQVTRAAERVATRATREKPKADVVLHPNLATQAEASSMLPEIISQAQRGIAYAESLSRLISDNADQIPAISRVMIKDICTKIIGPISVAMLTLDHASLPEEPKSEEPAPRKTPTRATRKPMKQSA